MLPLSTSVAGCWAPVRFPRPQPVSRSFFAGRVSTASCLEWGWKAPAAMARDWPVGSVPAMSLSSKSIGRTDAHVVGEGSRTAWTQKQLREPCWQEPPRPSPRLALVVTAPDAMRAELRRLKIPQLVATAAAFRRSAELTTPTAATKLALKSIATRYQHLAAEIEALDKHLDQLVAVAAPALVAIKGVGTDIASTLLTIAGDNPERLASEGAFAHLVGVAPIEASSGKITRYHLNRGGDRQGKRAVPAGRGPHGLGPSYQSLRGSPDSRGPHQARDHPLPQRLYRTRALPGAPGNDA